MSSNLLVVLSRIYPGHLIVRESPLLVKAVKNLDMFSWLILGLPLVKLRGRLNLSTLSISGQLGRFELLPAAKTTQLVSLKDLRSSSNVPKRWRFHYFKDIRFVNSIFCLSNRNTHALYKQLDTPWWRIVCFRWLWRKSFAFLWKRLRTNWRIRVTCSCRGSLWREFMVLFASCF